MRRLAALIIGVATAQPVQNYYGNADPHLERRRLAKRVPGSSTAAITAPSLRTFHEGIGCLDDDVNQNDAFLDTKCEKNSCGVEGPPCQAPAEIVPAPLPADVQAVAARQRRRRLC